MPKRMTRKKSIGPSPQIRGGSTVGGGTGPDKFSGTENTNAGSPKDQPREVKSTGKWLKTYGA